MPEECPFVIRRRLVGPQPVCRDDEGKNSLPVLQRQALSLQPVELCP